MAKKADKGKSPGDNRKTGAKQTSGKRTAKKTAQKTAKKITRKAAKSSKGTRKTLRSVKTPLTKAQLKEFRQMLLDKRHSILGDMSGIKAEAARRGGRGDRSDLSNMPTHPADLGTDNYEHEFSLGLLESERALLEEIDEALARIENRTFGICMGTGKRIGLARLRARPWAKYNIDYARMVEKGLVHPDEPDEEDL